MICCFGLAFPSSLQAVRLLLLSLIGCRSLVGGSGDGFTKLDRAICCWHDLLCFRDRLQAGEGRLMLITAYLGLLVLAYFGGYKVGYVVKFINQLGNSA